MYPFFEICNRSCNHFCSIKNNDVTGVTGVTGVFETYTLKNKKKSGQVKKLICNGYTGYIHCNSATYGVRLNGNIPVTCNHFLTFEKKSFPFFWE